MRRERERERRAIVRERKTVGRREDGNERESEREVERERERESERDR